MNTRGEKFSDVLTGFRWARSAKTRLPDVYLVRGARFPWNKSKADKEKFDLLTQFLARYAHCVFWLDERNANVADVLVPMSESGRDRNAGDWCGWFLLGEQSLAIILPKLYEGGWGMFFFNSERPPVLELQFPLLPSALSQPVALSSLVTKLDARVGVVSEIDDLEWFICFR